MTAKEIAQQLALRAEEIAEYLYSEGKKEGNEWRVGSTAGEKGSSLGIHLKGMKAGIWSDFATGESGDLLDLWAIKHNQTILQAMDDCRRYLGLKPFPALSTPMPRNLPMYKKPNKTHPDLGPKSVGFNYLMNERHLTAQTLAAFKVKQSGQDIVFPYFIDDEVVFLKYLKPRRENGKKVMWTEAQCQPVLFGWQAMPKNSRKVAICEGEIDAMSLHQLGIPALSVPFGGGGGNKHEWIENEFKRLEAFDDIYLCLDKDNAGKVAQNEIMERLGAHRCLIVSLPMKDANECLQGGMSASDMQYFFKEAKPIDPEELRDAINFEQKCWDYGNPKEGDFIGYFPLWEKAKNKIRFRLNELNIWTGMNGHGKTQFLGQILIQMLKQNAKICIASLEFKPEVLLHRMLRQITARNNCSREYHEAVFEWLHKKLWLFDLQGTAMADRLLEVFLYARRRYGVDVFVIDSFTTLNYAEDDFKGQKAFVEKLRDFKNQHSCQIHMVAHPRKGADEKNLIGKYDVRGTAAVSDLADNCFSVWRNKAKEEAVEKQRNYQFLNDEEIKRLDEFDCIWRCDKQRHGSWEGKLGFCFDEPSLQYLESEGRKPKPYLEYSALECEKD